MKFDQGGQNNYTTLNETIPVGFRPSGDFGAIQFEPCGFSVRVGYNDTAGACHGLGDPASSYATALGCWATSDPEPE